MADISTIYVNNTTYNIKDATARTNINNLSGNVYTKRETDDAIQEAIDGLETGVTSVNGQTGAVTIDLSVYAPKESPTLTGTPTAPTATTGTNTQQIATTAFVNATVAAVTSGAATYKGTVNAATDISGLSTYTAGWYWFVATAGTYVGETCEVGDMIICNSNYSSSYKASDFNVIQTNIDPSVYAKTADLGDLAVKDSASGSYTPSGSVSTPTITVTPSTTTVNSITSVGTLPTWSAAVNNEVLSFSFTQGTLPTKGENTTVMTGASATASEPTFSGTAGTVTVS